MTNRPLFVVIFALTVTFSYGDDWPEKIRSPLIYDYVHENFIVPNKRLAHDDLLREYEKILDFLALEMRVHIDNITNDLSLDTVSYQRAMLINGDLALKTFYGGRFVKPDDTRKAHEVADVYFEREIVDFYFACGAFNQFVDAWYEKTGIILREKVDLEENWASLYSIRKNKMREYTIFYHRAERIGSSLTKYNDKRALQPIEVFDDRGVPADLAFLDNKYALIIFGATWSDDFLEYKDSIQELYSGYANENFTVCVIFWGEKPETVKAFMEAHNYTFPARITVDPEVRNTYAPHIVTSYLVDPEGNLLYGIEYSAEWTDENQPRFLNDILPGGLIKKPDDSEN
jgi:hypothetical protein